MNDIQHATVERAPTRERISWALYDFANTVFSMNMAEPFTFNMNPIFAALMDKTVEEKLAAFRDPEWRKRAQEELDEPRFFKPNWEKLSVSETTKSTRSSRRSHSTLPSRPRIDRSRAWT